MAIKKLTKDEHKELLAILKHRFQKNPKRHKGIEWNEVEKRLNSKPEKLRSLNEMEITAGEPDVIGQDKKTAEFIFCDCASESPKGRRSICYDREGLLSRKEHAPKNTAIDMAVEMGIEILSEQDYNDLQKLGKFDIKTSSWLKTPSDIRELGGAIFGDFRFGRVFIYHNGAQSYYSGRAFRGKLSV